MRRLLAIVVVIAIFSSSAVFAMPNDYIAAWDFESETGGKITDLSGNGYHGVIRTTSTMFRNLGVGFAESYGLEIPKDTALNNTQMNAAGLGAVIRTKNAISISGWFKRNTANSNERYLFNMPNDQGFVGLAGSILADGKIKLQVRKLPSGLSSITTTDSPSTVGQWYHYTFMVKLPSESTGTATLAIYVNGEEAIKNTSIDVGGMTTFSTINWVTTSDDFRLGGHGTGVFNGVLDDVKVYDRVLADNEIELLARPGIPTELGTFKIGGYDVLSLPNLEVSNINEEGAQLYPAAFPLTGVQIGLSSGSIPRISAISLNGVNISNYETLEMRNGDVITYALQGAQWEGDAIRYFKVTLKSEGIVFSDVGFYEGQTKISSVKPGIFTAKTVVSSSYEQADDIIMIVILRDTQTGLLKNVKTTTGTVSRTLGAITLQNGITVDDDGRTYALELYLADKSFKAFTEAVLVQGE